jgi:hypothetical protein
MEVKAYTSWLNATLQTNQTNSTRLVHDLMLDLRDGLVLVQLGEILTGNKVTFEVFGVCCREGRSSRTLGLVFLALDLFFKLKIVCFCLFGDRSSDIIPGLSCG